MSHLTKIKLMKGGNNEMKIDLQQNGTEMIMTFNFTKEVLTSLFRYMGYYINDLVDFINDLDIRLYDNNKEIQIKSKKLSKYKIDNLDNLTYVLTCTYENNRITSIQVYDDKSDDKYDVTDSTYIDIDIDHIMQLMVYNKYNNPDDNRNVKITLSENILKILIEKSTNPFQDWECRILTSYDNSYHTGYDGLGELIFDPTKPVIDCKINKNSKNYLLFYKKNILISIKHNKSNESDIYIDNDNNDNNVILIMNSIYISDLNITSIIYSETIFDTNNIRQNFQNIFNICKLHNLSDRLKDVKYYDYVYIRRILILGYQYRATYDKIISELQNYSSIDQIYACKLALLSPLRLLIQRHITCFNVLVKKYNEAYKDSTYFKDLPQYFRNIEFEQTS